MALSVPCPRPHHGFSSPSELGPSHAALQALYPASLAWGRCLLLCSFPSFLSSRHTQPHPFIHSLPQEGRAQASKTVRGMGDYLRRRAQAESGVAGGEGGRGGLRGCTTEGPVSVWVGRELHRWEQRNFLT